MKPTYPTPIALAAGLAMSLTSLLASAQSAPASVTLYGNIDLAVRHGSGLAEFTPSPGTVSSATSGVNNTSVWGLRGSEDLGGGLRAVFNLEQGYNADTGAQASSSKFWDRQAWVGLQNAWGTLTVGRHRNLLGDSVSPVDPLGMRLASFNPNINVAALSQHRLGIDYGAAGSTTGSYRLDNSVKLTAKVSDLTLRAMVSAGEGASGHSTSLGATWASGGLTVSGAYGDFENLAERSLEAWVVGAAYKVGALRLSLTYGDNDAQTTALASTKNSTLGMGVGYAFTPQLELVTAAYRVERERTGFADDGFDRYVAFLEYALSKRTRLYGELDSTQWDNNYQGAANKKNATGFSVGVVHNF